MYSGDQKPIKKNKVNVFEMRICGGCFEHASSKGFGRSELERKLG